MSYLSFSLLLVFQSLYHPVIMGLFPCLSVLLDRELATLFGKTFEEATELLCETAFSVLQSRYGR